MLLKKNEIKKNKKGKWKHVKDTTQCERSSISIVLSWSASVLYA